ncbi:MAG: hypothetical protein AB1649_23210 [Chloroflexota bacterium]
MQNKSELIESLKNVAEKLSEHDLQEIRLYAEYLNTKRPGAGEHVGMHEFLEQHEEHGRMIITFILQRSRLIATVNRLAQIILSAQNVNDIHRSEAEEAIKKVTWIS